MSTSSVDIPTMTEMTGTKTPTAPTASSCLAALFEFIPQDFSLHRKGVCEKYTHNVQVSYKTLSGSEIDGDIVRTIVSDGIQGTPIITVDYTMKDTCVTLTITLSPPYVKSQTFEVVFEKVAQSDADLFQFSIDSLKKELSDRFEEEKEEMQTRINDLEEYIKEEKEEMQTRINDLEEYSSRSISRRIRLALSS
jgi:hypothetical protein